MSFNRNTLEVPATIKNIKIAVIGLGYVGLPLAIEFGKKFTTKGFDIDESRIAELRGGYDKTLELDSFQIKNAQFISFTSNIHDIADCNFFIITVPTPVDKNNKPDLNPLKKASAMVGGILKKNDVVVYESTVYPGATEEECVPILEKTSGLIFNKDFFAGYSPERINPGDKEHTVAKILKITSGSTPEAAEYIDTLYKNVISAGTFKASSIQVAEAAKVIENSQRDINIAFVNELAKIFNHLNIDTNDVLEAAGTKWNFLNFKPGLVGGHCIGVDPYYLAQKAQEAGYHPEIILAGRRLNDGMGEYVANQVIKKMIIKGIPVKEAKILVLGITFKENCPDVRNTKVVDVLRSLSEYQTRITVFDPWADPEEVKREYGWNSIKELKNESGFDAVILAVSHQVFDKIDIGSLCKNNRVIYDVKGILPKELIDSRL